MASFLKNLVCDDTPEGMGLCCVAGYLALLDIRMKAKPEGRLTAGILSNETGFNRAASGATLSRWKRGLIKCEGLKSCLMLKTGLKEEALPTFSKERAAFLSLKGKSFLVNRTEVTLTPKGPEPIRGRIIALSQKEWVEIGIHLEYSPISVKLGDQLLLSAEEGLWGTVVHIDGPIHYLLLPGSFHGERHHRLALGGVEPAHVKPVPGLDKSKD